MAAADWDDDSPRLQANLGAVLDQLARDAPRRRPLSIEDARDWQRRTMAGLRVPDAAYVGAFRGDRFERTLTTIVAQLDARYPSADDLDADGLEAVLDLAAWAHAEWVRIHPFANGNGRTARFWANVILMRYGIEPVVRMRPRPAHGYGAAGAAAMRGDWEPTATTFRRMLAEHYGTRRPLAPRPKPPRPKR